MNNNPPAIATEDRRVRTGKLLSRMHRYRSLLLKRWWVLIICIGLALGAGTLYFRVTPPVFISVGQMIVSIKLNTQQGSLYTEELGNFLGTQAALMQGGQVQDRARDRVANQNPGMGAKPVLLTVSILPKTTIFVLRASGENPEYTKSYLQGCMEEYINLKKEMLARTTDMTTAGLTEQLLRLEPEIQKCDTEMNSFLSTNDVALLQEVSGLGGYLTVIYQELAEAQTEADLLQTMTLDQSLMLGLLLGGGQSQTPTSSLGSPAGSAGMMNGGPGGQTGVSAPATIGADYLTVKQQIQLLNADRSRYAEILKPKHPQMVALDLEIEKLGRVLDIYRQQSLDQLEAKKTAIALQITNLQSQIRERGKEDLGLSLKASHYERLKAKADRVQSLYDQLLAELQTLDVNKEMSPESVTIYQAATDASPDPNLFAKGMITTGILGLGLGVLILILLDRLDDRMNSFTELEELFDEDVLGQIPRERAARKQGGMIPVLQQNDQRHSFVEAYRNLRSSLLYMSDTEARPRTLLVTSSVPGDGKSLTATNLAITLAMSGSRVLLVDADLRKGGLKGRLQVEAEAGMTEHLIAGTDWHSLVKPTAVATLFLLPRGATTQRSSELFIGPVMDRFLKETAEQYDYVVIDTAPVMAADDVTSLAPRVDGVLFVVRAEYTSSRVAHSALNMLYQRKANVLGLVLNSVHASAGDYYYYYRYKDYYHTNKAA
jgi:capsular exopolysaccharide synthesis family protein